MKSRQTRDQRARRAGAIAAVAAAIVLLPGLGATPLVDWDEGIYAQVGRSVLADGPLRLSWNGDPYHRKPPLLFWSIAASYGVFGVNEAAARLPSALAGIGTAAVVAAVVARRAGIWAALGSVLCLLGSALFVERGGRRACTDALVIFFSVLALWRATVRGNTRARRRTASIAVGLAVLSKGFVGLIAPGALLLSARRDPQRRRDAAAIGTLGLALAAPWYASQLLLYGWPFVASHFGREIVDRMFAPIHGHDAPWWYPLRTLWDGGGPWIVAALAALVAAALFDRPGLRSMGPWAVATALVLIPAMTIQTKLPWYSLPAIPMLAVIAGLALGHGGTSPWQMVPRTVMIVAAFVAVSAIPAVRQAVLNEERGFEPFRTLGGRIATLGPDTDLVGATSEHPTLVFYGGRPLRLYDLDALEQVLLDDTVPPFAGIVPSDRAAALIEAGFVEIDRLGGDVLLHRPHLLPSIDPVPPPQSGL
jgi:4-amino-4-deoxy-L-arabinose transferase-like glycosyltransferase